VWDDLRQAATLASSYSARGPAGSSGIEDVFNIKTYGTTASLDQI
jgi:hypothetical protein